MKPGDCLKPNGGIKRINYQKEQASKRLAPLGWPGLPGSSYDTHSLDAAQLQTGSRSPERPSGDAATLPAPAGPASGNTQSFAERCLSPLLLRSLPDGLAQPAASGDASCPPATCAGGLAQVHSPGHPAGDRLCRQDSCPEASHFRGIPVPPVAVYGQGNTSPDSPLPLLRDETLDAWLFPVISSRLRPVLGTAGRGYSSAGVLSAPASHPGQLFAVEALLAANPALEADVQWGGSSGGFELLLLSNDAGLLARLLTELAGALQRDSIRQIRGYSSLQPGPLLRRHLAAGQQDAIAVIDAASRWNSLGCAERLLVSCPGTSLSLRAERSYCILSGSDAELAAVLPALTELTDK
ncbi:hypothetical protein [Paenibacillus sp. MMS20-IR301]|uniref:hypothetical protein n=1 Tax=Paenibacillus sp. MMS20-IR301 TaxID=2895946 RepID=UPI0028E900CC|nr:hypothetical protein [Paenibacillus sp. MMS20-IR301]WNS43036.1 hypothetical protein LOS79_29485 [Paenibacillus sp. MMS20-IR301]